MTRTPKEANWSTTPAPIPYCHCHDAIEEVARKDTATQQDIKELRERVKTLEDIVYIVLYIVRGHLNI